jgi:hypothetical protein
MRFLRPAVLVFLMSMLLRGPASAQAAPALTVTSVGNAVQIGWQGDVRRTSWPLVEVDAARVPAQLVTLRLLTSAPATIQLSALTSQPWGGAVTPHVPALPQPLGAAARPDLIAPVTPALPPAPVVVLREGTVRGQRLVVLAISPLFTQDGRNQAATSFSAAIPNAAPLSDPDALWRRPAPFIPDAIPPANPAANGPAWQVQVSSGGMQQLSGAALAAAGLSTTTISPTLLHLWRAGTEWALEERGTADGRIDGADSLRFYAPPPGNRWNASATYWLTLESTPGLRVLTRPISLTVAPARSTALQSGLWRQNALYDSGLPGADGDHWYAADLRTGPGQPTARMSFGITPTLPLVAGTTTLTVTGTAYTGGLHQLQVQLGAVSDSATWSGTGSWSRTVALSATAAVGALNLLPGAAPDGIEPDSIAWQRAVALDFAAGGAAFAGAGGLWRYELQQLAADRTLYAVSNPAQPTIISLPDGASSSFVAGPAPEAYLLVSENLATPAITPFAATDWAARADAIYIAPQSLHASLAPLLAQRQSTGRTARVVDTAAIYAAWSGGDVAPEALRAFLRYAAATWSPAPLAVTLVGDGTSDPLNYLGRNNPNLVPPYLAMVDPWLGETACDSCYAQLDGASPLSESLPDLLIGRLPVKSAAELSAVVDKIIGYETAPGGAAWRMTVGFIADNFRTALGASDGSGDLAAFADITAALQPPGVAVERVYYDPWKRDAGGQPLPDLWREPDAAQARLKTLALLQQGAGIINYVGHSHQWQWAITDPALSEPYLLSLYDIDSLSNGAQLPILLEMTCLTSAFQQPAFSGTTLDERFILQPNGGAVATWGSSGLGVAHGHDALSRGFYRHLWGSPQPVSLGSAIGAGQLELFAQSGCCQDSLRTYTLLGDPLMSLRAYRTRQVYIPRLQR